MPHVIPRITAAYLAKTERLPSAIIIGILLVGMVFLFTNRQNRRNTWNSVNEHIIQPSLQALKRIQESSWAWPFFTLWEKIVYEIRWLTLQPSGHLWHEKAATAMSPTEKELSEAIHDIIHSADLKGKFDSDREKIRRSDLRKLTELLEPLNKGFIPHMHDNSMLPAEETLKVAVNHAWLRMSFTEPACLKDGRIITEGAVEFEVKKWDPKKDDPAADKDGASFEANEWIPVKSFLERHFGDDHERGLKCISEHLILEPDGGWERFNAITSRFKVVFTESVFKWKFEEMIKKCKKYKFSGFEVRVMAIQKISTDDGRTKLDVEKQLEILREVVKAHKGIRVSVILATSRRFTRELMERDWNLAVRCREAFPDLVHGFDIVGCETEREDSGASRNKPKGDSGRLLSPHEIETYLRDCLTSKPEHGMNLLLHAGEASPNYFKAFGLRLKRWNSLVQVALDLGAKRISHFLDANDFQILEAKRRGVIIESCLISSQKLGTLENIGKVPIHRWLDMGLPVTIGPDNPTIYGCDLLDEFMYVLWFGGPYCLWLLKEVIKCSITGHFMGHKDQQSYIDKFDTDWENWIKEMKSNSWLLTEKEGKAS